jgi:hypothetical protein
MSDWYSQSVGDIGAAFGQSSRFYTPAVDERAFNTTPVYDERSFSDATGPSSAYWRGIEDPIARFQQQAAEELAKFESGGTGTTPGGTGGNTGTYSGDLAILNQWDSAFAAAAAATGLDANHIKAVATVEHGWNNDGTMSSHPGSGATGLMQVVPGGYPALEAKYPNWRTDPHQNIMLGAEILKAKIAENGGDIGLGTQRYLGVGTDPWTGYTTERYWNEVQQYWNQLNSSGGSYTGGTTGGGGASYQQMFGVGVIPDWGEFGAQSDALCNGQPCYTYGTQYGLNGSQHTGVDVPMALNTPYRAPMGGVVTCAGTGIGQGTDDGGCAAFGDTFGSGAGRVEILLDNGAMLIFGHSSKSMVQPGQRVNAGDVLGTSGGMNSEHIHLEARVRDSSTPSGWRIVDPQSVLGGASIGGSTGGTTGGSTPSVGYEWWRLPPEVLFGGPS